jgi:hypothetical protein
LVNFAQNSGMRKFAWLCAFIFIGYSSKAQVNIKDSAINAPMFYVTYAYQLNSGDISNRFGSSSAIGGGFQIKIKKNWLFGAEYNYLFGGKVKDEASILSRISTSDGFLITSSGEYAQVNFTQAGYNISVKAGKIIPVLNPNPNSGILISLQPGFLQHRIKINNPNNTAPQLKGDYKKGYDEMANGFSITEFLGYFYMGNKRLYSFYAGFEFTQAFTKFRRAYNFNTMSRDTEQKHDYFYSFRVGWLIPLYKRAPAGYYYN